MIHYQTGRLYLIHNYVTREGTYFEPREILNHQGHKILYGEVRGHQIRISRGPEEFDGHPVCIPVPNFATTGRMGVAAMALCIKQTGGDFGTGRLCGALRISGLPKNTDPQVQAVKGITEEETEPVFSIGKQCAEMWGGTHWVEGWTGRTPNRDGLIRCAQLTLRLYEDVLKEGRLPRWFRDMREVYLAKQKTISEDKSRE